MGHPLKCKGCMCIHDRVRLMLSLVRVGKNGPAKFFSTQITTCTKLMFYLGRVGKEWAGPVFPHPLKTQGCMHIHDRVWLMFSLVGGGGGGERMGRPGFSPPR